MTMETKGTAVAAKTQRQRGGGSQLGDGGNSLARAWRERWRPAWHGGGSLARARRWRQRSAWQQRQQLGKSAALAKAASLAAEAAAWREQDNGDGMMASEEVGNRSRTDDYFLSCG